jgi:alpha-L-fucosidase
MNHFIRYAAQIQPSERQLALQEMEFYSFIHFTVNTYTDKEWGDGSEDPAIFNPVEFDADQWVEACQAAGTRGLILT